MYDTSSERQNLGLIYTAVFVTLYEIAVKKRVYSCGIVNGIRARCQASADRLLI